MSLQVFFLVVFFVVCSCLRFMDCLGDADNVIFVASIFRHGDRTPITFYPTDPWADRKWWPENFGQLTKRGMRQHYNLGIKCREKYDHLLSKSYNCSEIQVISTDFDRTIMSAMSHLAGLYRVDPEDEFVPGLSWKPIPIRTIPLGMDNLMAMKSSCPQYDWALNQFTKTQYYKDVYSYHEPTLKYLTEKTGIYVDTLLLASYVYDTLHIEDLNNMTLPEWSSTVYPEKLINISVNSFQMQTFTPEMKRLKGGPLIKEILNEMDHVITNSPLAKKYSIFSAHDTTIVAVLNSLGLYKFDLPPYAAHIVFELLSPDSLVPEHKVRILYQDEVLFIPQCGTECPLSKFKLNYSWLIPKDYYAECRLNIKETLWNLTCGVFTLLTIFCLICIAVIKLRSSGTSRYAACHDSNINHPSIKNDIDYSHHHFIQCST